jgi:aminoglycoside phosphotransferase family enzyme
VVHPGAEEEQGRDALSLLAAGELGAAQIDAVAERLARFHAESGLGVPAPFAEPEWLGRLFQPIEANLALLRGETDIVSREDVEALADQTRRFAAAHRARFLARGHRKNERAFEAGNPEWGTEVDVAPP